MASSKYQEISLELETYIREKCPCGRLPGMLQLSKELGVHHVTLKKAIRLLEDRGLLTIDGTRGTFVNIHYGRKTGDQHTLGVVGLEAFRSISHLNDKYRNLGCRLVAIGIPNGLEAASEAEFLLQMPLAGVVFLGSSARRELIMLLRQHSLPVVGNIQNGLPWMNGVEFAHYESYRTALRHLRELQHRRIAIMETQRPPEFQFYLNNVRSAFADELGEFFDPELFRVRDDLQEQYRIHGEKYLEVIFAERMNFFFGLPRPPTALIVNASFLRAGLPFLRKLGIRIPQDLSVISVCSPQVQDSFFSNLVASQDDLVEWAIPRLLGILAGNPLPVEKKLIPLRFIPGHSTIPVSSLGPPVLYA